MTLVESFEAAVGQLAEQAEFHGVEIVIAAARRHGRTTDLRLVIDRPGGVDLVLCGRVSTALNAALAERPETYSLAVESAGLDRPLVRPADYDRFRGSRVRVVTNLPIGGAKTHRGQLLGLSDGQVRLRTIDGERDLPFATIKSACIEYDFRADLAREKRGRKAP
ncbi:MAG: ribosome maturation factor RimP [Vulcanimicrobiaceae bacterium]